MLAKLREWWWRHMLRRRDQWTIREQGFWDMVIQNERDLDRLLVPLPLHDPTDPRALCTRCHSRHHTVGLCPEEE